MLKRVLCASVLALAVLVVPTPEVSAWPTDCRVVSDPLTTATRCEDFIAWPCCHRAVHICHTVSGEYAWQRGQYVGALQTSRTNKCGSGHIVYRGIEYL